MRYFALRGIAFSTSASNPHSGIKRRIEINKTDNRIRELAPVAQPFQIIAEIEPIH